MSAPRTRDLLRRFIPLAASDMGMALQGPILAAGVARLANPEVSLAGYSSALAVALLLEGPIMMLLQASTALSTSRERFRRLVRFATVLCLALATIHLTIAFSPLRDWVFGDLLGLTADVQAKAWLAFAVMPLWAAVIGWRRVYQGLLIRHGETGSIGWAAFARLAVVVATIGCGLSLGGDGALFAGLAYQVGSLTEMGLVILVTARLFRSGRAFKDDAASQSAARDVGTGDVPSYGELVRYYAPLATTMMFVMLARPLVSSGLARAEAPILSLAVWPVVWSAALFFGNGARMLQQLAITTVHDRESYRVFSRFALGIAGVFFVTFFALGWTPLGYFYLDTILSLPDRLIPAALVTMRLMGPVPLLVAAQAWCQSFLVRTGKTAVVNQGAMINTAVIGGVVFAVAVPRLLEAPGLYVVAVGFVAGLIAEVAYIAVRTRGLRREFRTMRAPSGGSQVRAADVEASGTSAGA